MTTAEGFDVDPFVMRVPAPGRPPELRIIVDDGAERPSPGDPGAVILTCANCGAAVTDMVVDVEPIELVIETSAAPDLAWAYLTEPDRVAEWFTEVVPLGSVGDPYRIDFGEGSIVEGEILELEPGRRFAHGWAWTDAEPSRPTRVEWRVEPLAGGGSRIVLRHEGWAEAGTDDAIRDDHEAYWSGYLDDLRDLLEEAGGG